MKDHQPTLFETLLTYILALPGVFVLFFVQAVNIFSQPLIEVILLLTLVFFLNKM